MESKKQTGITLVALVVTIVVLLILAGVSISLVLGQNGLISNAKDARDKTLESEKQESISLNNASDYIKQTAGVSASEITKDDYGKVVTNYNADGKTWEIFYADDSNIYLITRENCGSQSLNDKIESYNGTLDFDGSEAFKEKFPAVQAGWLSKIYIPSNEGRGVLNYSSSYENMKATEYLLDSTVWNKKYLEREKADWAVGGLTLELLVASYNKKNEENVQIDIPEKNGYNYNDVFYKRNSIGEKDDITSKNNQSNNIINHGYCYWIACPGSYTTSNIRYIFAQEEYIDYSEYSNYSGIRPVVCLKSNIKLKLNEDRISYSIE